MIAIPSDTTASNTVVSVFILPWLVPCPSRDQCDRAAWPSGVCGRGQGNVHVVFRV